MKKTASLGLATPVSTPARKPARAPRGRGGAPAVAVLRRVAKTGEHRRTPGVHQRAETQHDQDDGAADLQPVVRDPRGQDQRGDPDG